MELFPEVLSIKKILFPANFVILERDLKTKNSISVNALFLYIHGLSETGSNATLQISILKKSKPVVSGVSLRNRASAQR